MNEDAPARLAIGFPLGQMIPTRFFSHWLQMDQSPVVGAITVTGVYVCQNMDVLVNKALSVGVWDRLVVFEHDMLPPGDALTRIAAYRDEHHIVGSMYFQRQPPHHANALMEDADHQFNPINPQVVKKWCDDPKLYEVHGVGLGLTSIARHVLEEWDPNIEMFATDNTFGSHDLWFSHYARKQGYKIFVDTSVVCEHLTEMPIGLVNNQPQVAHSTKTRAPAMSAPKARRPPPATPSA